MHGTAMGTDVSAFRYAQGNSTEHRRKHLMTFISYNYVYQYELEGLEAAVQFMNEIMQWTQNVKRLIIENTVIGPPLLKLSKLCLHRHGYCVPGPVEQLFGLQRNWKGSVQQYKNVVLLWRERLSELSNLTKVNGAFYLEYELYCAFSTLVCFAGNNLKLIKSIWRN